MFSVERSDGGLKFRVDRRSVHPSEKDETGVVVGVARGCDPSDEELAELETRRGKEVVYWTSEAEGGLLDFWVEDEDDHTHGPFICTSIEETNDDYSPVELKLRYALLERTLGQYYDWHCQESRERHMAQAAIRDVRSELENDLHRARIKREFLEETRRAGVDRLKGMEEAFQIALNRVQAHEPG